MMKGFKACLYKDICLLRSITGVFGIVLTVLLALCSVFGMNDAMDKAGTVQPYAIGVIDNDGSIFTKAFISQLRALPVFSEIKVVSASDSEFEYDEKAAPDELFRTEKFHDCAVVIIIPEDYFYSLYDMKGENCKAAANADMPLEARLTTGMMNAVSDVMSAERSSWYSAYMLYTGGKMDDKTFDEFCDNASVQMLDSVLARKSVFDNETRYTDAGEKVIPAFAASAVGMLMLFICTGVLKTLPEEAQSGILGRFLTVGGSVYALLFSKLLTAFIFTLPGTVIVMLILGIHFSPYALGLLLICFLAAFFFVFMLCMLCRNAQQLMLAGCAATIVSLLMGGVIYPINLMPAALRPLRLFCIPYHIMRGLQKGEAESIILPGIIAVLTGIIAFLSAVMRFSAGKERKK